MTNQRSYSMGFLIFDTSVMLSAIPKKVNKSIVILLSVFILLLGLVFVHSSTQAQGSNQNTNRRIVVCTDGVVNKGAQEVIVKGAGGLIIKRLGLINAQEVYLP